MPVVIPPLSPEAQKKVIEARAELAWGESHEKVREMLLGGGLSSYETDSVMEALLEERAASFRSRGIRDLLVGLAIAAAGFGGGIGFVAVTGLVGKFAGMLVVVGFYGLFLTARGLFNVLSAGKFRGPDSDVSDD